MKAWRKIWVSGMVVLLTVLAGGAVANATAYNYQAINYPGADGTFAYGINDAGQVAGIYDDSSGHHGFLYDGSSFTPLNYPGVSRTYAYGINDAGQVAGFYIDSSEVHGFLYDGSSYTPLDYPGADHTYVYGINDAGQVAGRYDDSGGIHGFLYDGSSYTTLDYPGTCNTFAYDINDAGQVVGEYQDSSGVHGFLYDGSSYTPLDYPGASGTRAYGINDAGQVAGTYQDSSGQYGFLYDGSSYTTLDYPGAYITCVYDINDAGQVAGFYGDISGTHGFLATPVLMSYEFSCYYNNGDGDYYSGDFYDYDTYEVGETIPFTDENGQPGYYEITSKTLASDGVDGQVFVDSYYDRESSYIYTPVHAGAAVGTEGLGTERDYIMFNGMVLNRFGIGPEGSEEVHYEADVTYLQYRFNRAREPFRSLFLNWLYYSYLLHPGYPFDDDL